MQVGWLPPSILPTKHTYYISYREGERERERERERDKPRTPTVGRALWPLQSYSCPTDRHETYQMCSGQTFLWLPLVLSEPFDKHDAIAQ